MRSAIKYQDKHKNEVLLATSDTHFFTLFLQKKRQSEFSEFRSIYNFSPSNPPFTFTGKEKDSETGFSYFGARYYDSDLSGLFTSVDPMADKYPSISPYAYCAWNPVKLIDPDGKTIWLLDEDGSKVQYTPNMKPRGGDAVQQQINSLNGIYSTDIGMELLEVLIDSGKDYLISNEPSSLANSASTTGTTNGSISKMGGYNDIYNLSHELFHAFRFENGQGGATIYNEVEAYIFSQCLSDTYTANTGISVGSKSAHLSRHPNTTDGELFEQSMYNIVNSNTFPASDFDIAVRLFKSESNANAQGGYNSKKYKERMGNEHPLLPSFYPLIRSN